MLQTTSRTTANREDPALISRREMLWAAFSATAIGTALLSGGCAKAPAEISADLNPLLKKVTDAIAAHRPDWQAPLAAGVMPPLQGNFDQNLENGRQTLLLVRDVLKLHKDIMVDSFTGAHINFGPCLYADRTSYPEHLWKDGAPTIPEARELSRCAVWLRGASIAELRTLREKIDEVAAAQGGNECSQVEAVLYASLSTQLAILADRIESRTLLAGENILNFRHKTGDTSELVGRTEHLDESTKQLEQLAAIRKRKAGR